MFAPRQFTIGSSSHQVDALKESIIYHVKFVVGIDPSMASEHDWLNGIMYAVRDHLVDHWMRSTRATFSQQARQVYYLSMEFLIGRTLSNALLSIGIYDQLKQAVEDIGLELDKLLPQEDDPGLGNGGLGRLAACFMDSLATLKLPAVGYGIRYEYGMFKQSIIDGQQCESPDNWLEYGFAWEFARHEIRHKVCFGGCIQIEGSKSNWLPTDEILACAYDQIIPGYNTKTANTLRLWSARASNAINLGKFNQGDYFAAVESKNFSENVSRVLYPNDSTESGRELRLYQEYFLVSATMQDILRRHWMVYRTYDNLADKIAVHLNDTHPVLAIPELMRLLIDEHNYTWEMAWEMSGHIFSYTNHTLMSEALETWPVVMLGKILPRHLQLIFEINDRFLKMVQQRFPNDNDLLYRVSIIDENHGRLVRMAWLAVIMSHSVNGVSALHSELMVQSLFYDFARIFPDRFCNKTNGITPRRWLGLANPSLAKVIDAEIGIGWRTDLLQLETLKKYTDIPLFKQAIAQAKLVNKERLARYIAQNLDVVVNPNALFDVQIKRIHEYKRQLLNVLYIITRYNHILKHPDADWVWRVSLFSGKAASSYFNAKQIIHLMNDVANVINNDKRIGNRLKVVFIPNYSVSIAELMIPAADLSEQISLAGTEASGTSNMKFALNGALTIGTMDGANVEMCQYIGEENLFIFGNRTEEVKALRAKGYVPRQYYEKDEDLHLALNQIVTGFFSPEEPKRYVNLFDSLVNFGDTYQVLADYRSYIETQEAVDKLYRNQDEWLSRVIINMANMGYFSADRTIAQYAEEIWRIQPINY